jgi:NADH:ubiquinone oxidoreductase subunit E
MRSTAQVLNHTITITMCVGSSCHLRGAYEMLNCLKELIKLNALEQKVTLKGSFCMERCTEAVTIKINEEVFSVAAVGEMKDIFQRKVIHPLSSEQ